MENFNSIPGDEKFQELIKYYAIAKKHLIYSENVLQRTSLGVVNEMRNAFDHMIKAIHTSDNNEFDKAVRHLKRAAYDSCELISMDFSLKIDNKLKNYSFDIISQVLPDYYSSIYPRLIAIQKQIASQREQNDEIFNKENEGPLENYTSLYSELIEIDIKISDAIVGMGEAQRRLKKEQGIKNRRNIIVNILVGVVSALITAVILYFTPFGDKKAKSPTESDRPNTELRHSN